MPKVNHVRQELAVKLNDYRSVTDFLNGPTAVRAAGIRYLPEPEPTLANDSETAVLLKQARYKAYKTRAVFFGAVYKTWSSLIGQVFAKETAVSMPDAMSEVIIDVDHSGTSLEVQAKQAVGECLGWGRGGLFVDYPNIKELKQSAPSDNGEVHNVMEDTTMTKAEVDALELRPKILLYTHAQCINWRKASVGARLLATLVVLEESRVVEDDGFEETHETVYRVLRLDKATREYSQEVWAPSKSGNEAYELVSATVPLDAGGKPFDEIPYAPFGSENNEFEPDAIPLLDLVELAAGLWRNSADYQENAFMLGQTTVFFKGLTVEWTKVAMKDGVRLGSREAVLLPEKGDAGTISAPANTVVHESMTMIMEQMVALNAQLTDNSGGAKTATEDSNDQAASSSVLSSVANNCSSAYMRAFEWYARFKGVELPVEDDAEDALDFQLNTDFAISRMTPQERQVLLAEWQGGGLTWKEYRWNLKRAGFAYEDDDKAKQEVDAEREARQEADLINNPGGVPAKPGEKADPTDDEEEIP